MKKTKVLPMIKKISLGVILFSIFFISVVSILALWNMLPVHGETLFSLIMTVFIIGGLSIIGFVVSTLLLEESDNTNEKGKSLIG